jgi:hypothetical protein
MMSKSTISVSVLILPILINGKLIYRDLFFCYKFRAPLYQNREKVSIKVIDVWLCTVQFRASRLSTMKEK